ncbi:hypothetical protein CF327_g7558, partial [Tilletia walkeri]
MLKRHSGPTPTLILYASHVFGNSTTHRALVCDQDSAQVDASRTTRRES